MATTFQGRYRAVGAVVWTSLFSGASSPYFDWAWVGVVPPGEYELSLGETVDGVPGAWSDPVLVRLTAKRVLDAATFALYQSQRFDLHARIRVANGSGTLVNLQGRWTRWGLALPHADAPIASLSVELVRETHSGGLDSLSPFVSASLLNRLDDGVTFSPLLQLGRTVTLDVALTVEHGARPADGSPLWYEVFRGQVSAVPGGKRDEHRIRLQCTDLGGRLQLAKSEAAYTYPAGMTYEAAFRAVLDNNTFTWAALHVPVPTGKVLEADYAPGVQKTVWEQCTALAQSMAAVCWFRYVGTSGAALTLFTPARDKDYTDLTLSRLYDFDELELKDEQVKNVGYAQLTNEAGERVDIGPVEDADSIDLYGGTLGIRRAFWINFAEDSPVRSVAQGTDVLNAAVADVANPELVATARTPPLVFADCAHDLYAVPADPRFFDAAQQLAPASVSVEDRADARPFSPVGLRGKPSGGYRMWRTRPTPPGGSTVPLGVRISGATPDGAGTVAVSVDVDAGVSYTQWRVDGGAWTDVALDGGGGRFAAFDVAQTAAAQLLEVRGLSVANVPGAEAHAVLPAYVPPPPPVPALLAAWLSVTDTGADDVYDVGVTGIAMDGLTLEVKFYRNGALVSTETAPAGPSVSWTATGAGDASVDDHKVLVRLYDGGTTYGIAASAEVESIVVL